MRGDAPVRDRSPRLAGIEGMRAIAATSIVVYHVWLYGAANGESVAMGPLTKGFDNLRAGVTLFFVLSGFLLFKPFVAAALRTTPTPSVRQYFRNRALRILPAYWVILLLIAVFLHRELFSAPEQLVANLFFLQNYVPDYIFGAGIVPAWSLVIEVVFYLTVPLLGLGAILLASRTVLSRTTAAFVPVAVMLFIGIAAKAALALFEGDGQRVWTLSFLTHADWFAAGMLIAVIRVLWEDGRVTPPRFWRLGAVVTAAVLFAVAAKLFYSGTLSALEYQTPIAFACALILAIVVMAPADSRVVRVLDWRPIFALGLISYSLFLWHDPLVRGFREGGMTLDGTAGFLVNLALIGIVAVAAATITYRYVEKPALARKKSWRKEIAGARPSTPVLETEQREVRAVGASTPAGR